jgi:hypothetical protein
MYPMRSAFFLLFALCLGACASPTPVSGPAEAIRLAAENPGGVYVQVVMDVQSTGTDETGMVFLNSEPDYRSLKSLNVALSPEVVKKLILERKIDPIQGFLHHTILATGIAKRVQITITNGPYAGRFYFQTHLEVTDANDIQLLTPGTKPPIPKINNLS